MKKGWWWHEAALAAGSVETLVDGGCLRVTLVVGVIKQYIVGKMLRIRKPRFWPRPRHIFLFPDVAGLRGFLKATAILILAKQE